MMASEPFVFHGRSLCVWDHFQATPAEADELTRTRYAVVRQKRYQTADVKPEPPAQEAEPATAPKRRRSYKRRDLTAEPS